MGNPEQFQYEFHEGLEEYPVRLIATSIDGCVDTAVHRFQFDHQTVFYWPKSFTPNGDDLNDQFRVEGDFSALTEFELSIFDRWGHQVFRSNNPYTYWDGSHPQGNKHGSGVYSMTLRYKVDGEDIKVLQDQIVISSAGKRVPLK
ncbi:MAG: hypothetical protein Salg2KO_16890 [Salibacteraceae bacterium]